MSYLLMSDYLLIMSASKPFFTVTQCSCPRGKSLSLRTNLQVLVLGPQVQVLEYTDTINVTVNALAFQANIIASENTRTNTPHCRLLNINKTNYTVVQKTDHLHFHEQHFHEQHKFNLISIFLV